MFKELMDQVSRSEVLELDGNRVYIASKYDRCAHCLFGVQAEDNQWPAIVKYFSPTKVRIKTEDILIFEEDGKLESLLSSVNNQEKPLDYIVFNNKSSTKDVDIVKDIINLIEEKIRRLEQQLNQLDNQRETWTFSHYDKQCWENLNEPEDRRVLLIAAEPNGNNPRCQCDMGDWFRTASIINGYHSGQRFFIRNMGQLFGALNSEIFSKAGSLNANRINQLYDAGTLQVSMNHMRYADLKAQAGGAQANTEEVRTWVQNHLEEVLQFWLPTDAVLPPTHVVVQGGHAHTVYQTEILPLLRQYDFQGYHIGMPHPSNSMGYEKNRLLTMQMEENFRSIQHPLKILRFPK